MKKPIKLLSSLLLLSFSAPQLALASSVDECQIWSCLPDGFHKECSAAYSAMKTRIERGQPPLPEKNSCVGFKNTGEGYDFRILPAAFIPATEFKKARWVEATECNPKFGKGPKNCIKEGRAISVTHDDQVIGETFYTR